MSVILLTNNIQIARHLPHASSVKDASHGKGALCLFFDADALAVLTAARDAIHGGWKLTHHPLYGNYRPGQQPYRSLILERPAEQIDTLSLKLIEEALLVYTGCPALLPCMAPASLREACSLLDFELMRLPMQQAGIWSEKMEEIAQKERPVMNLV